jgi:hypothetical protein
MKQASTSGVFAIAFVSLLVLGLVSRVQARECSNASIKGTYGFSCEGTIVGVGPIAVIGVFTRRRDWQWFRSGNSELKRRDLSRSIPYRHLYCGCRLHRLFREYRTRRLGHPQRFRD